MSKLKRPHEYSEDVSEALTLLCGRFLEILPYSRTIRMRRLCIAEAERFPQGFVQYFDIVFSEAQEALSAHLQKTFGVVPNWLRKRRRIFWAVSEHLDDEAIRTDFDLSPIHGQSRN